MTKNYFGGVPCLKIIGIYSKMCSLYYKCIKIHIKKKIISKHTVLKQSQFYLHVNSFLCIKMWLRWQLRPLYHFSPPLLCTLSFPLASPWHGTQHLYMSPKPPTHTNADVNNKGFVDGSMLRGSQGNLKISLDTDAPSRFRCHQKFLSDTFPYSSQSCWLQSITYLLLSSNSSFLNFAKKIYLSLINAETDI